jgi:anti-sigma factor RsiW
VTCREFADFILDYTAGELPADAREPFEWHLSRCQNCQQYIEQYKSTIQAGRLAWTRNSPRTYPRTSSRPCSQRANSTTGSKHEGSKHDGFKARRVQSTTGSKHERFKARGLGVTLTVRDACRDSNVS